MMAVQAVDSEIRGIMESAGGEIEELEPDLQELLLSYSKAAMELRTSYMQAREARPGLPPYEDLVTD
jgi:hypothetical protein